MAGSLGHVAEGAVFVLIYLGFMLASRRGFQDKLGELFSEGGARAEAILVFSRVEHGVERYIWVQTMVIETKGESLERIQERLKAA